MTVIAWDGQTLSADRRMVNSGLIRTTTKLRRFGELRVGCSGDAAAMVEMFAWIESGRNTDNFPRMQREKDDWCVCVVIEADRTISLYERSPLPIRIEDQQYACGSGRDFALAAMFLGHTAAEAVEVAAHFECGCGNGVDSLD